MLIVPVSLGAIIADERAQSRADRDDSAVAEYAEAMAAGATFPPLVVFQEGDRYWLAEGFHRHAAGLAAGLIELPCDVRPGGLRDAILHSAGANAMHGVRRTNADKRRSALMLLEDEEWGQWTDREIARRCSIGHPLVADVRAGLTGSSSSETAPRTYRTRHGGVSKMRTGRIGRKADPVPRPDPAAQQVALREPETLRPITSEEEIWRKEVLQWWSEGRLHPHWKEEFARLMHNEGKLSRIDRDRIILAAWNASGLTEDERSDAARRSIKPPFPSAIAALSPSDRKAVLPLLMQYAGTAMAINVRDQIEHRFLDGGSS